MKIKRNRTIATAIESPLLELSPFQAYSQRKVIESKIAKLQEQSKALRTIIESEFRTNQLRLVSEDNPTLALVRQLRTVKPFTNPGYTYYVYSLDSAE